MLVLVACLLLLLFAPAGVAAPGALDATFGSGGWVVTHHDPPSIAYMHVQDDGRIVIGGSAPNYYTEFTLSRLLPDGRLDSTFGSGGTIHTGLASDARAVEDRAGRVIVAGRRVDRDGSAFTAKRYLPDGTRDRTFGGGTVKLPAGGVPASERVLSALAATQAGGIVAVLTGPNRDPPGKDVCLIRLRGDGTFDRSFGGDGIVVIRPGRAAAGINDVVVARGGQIVGAGFVQDARATRGSPTPWPMLLRLRRDGALDPRFGRRGVAVHRNPDDAGPLERIVRGGGRRLVALHAAESRPRGDLGQAIVLRGFRGDGRNDRSFGRRGMGRIDLPSFYAEANRELQLPALLRQPDGKFLAVGYVSNYCTIRGPCYASPALARFTSSGMADREFGGAGFAQPPPSDPQDEDVYGFPKQYEALRTAVVLPDERLLAAGAFQFSQGLVGRFSDVVAPRLASHLPARRRLRVGQPIRVRLECLDSGPACTGRLRLHGRTASGRRYVAGDKAFTLTPGTPSALEVPLIGRAAAQLAEDGRIVVRAVVLLRDPVGNSRKFSGRILLTRAHTRAGASVSAARFFGMHADQAFEQRGDERAAILAAVRRTGAGIVRQQLAWSRIEREPGVYDWSEFDAYVEAVARADLDLLPILIEPPRFRTRAPANPQPGLYAPSRWRAFGAFAALAVARYGPTGLFWAGHPDVPRRPVRDWQVWNEPSLAYFWRPEPNARAFGSMLRVVGAAIRRADPGAQVIAPALPESRYGVPLMKYLARMSAAAGRPGYDVAAVNPYARTVDDMTRLLRRTRRWLDRHGRRRVPILVAEFGWASFDERDEWIQAERVAGAVRTLAGERQRLRLAGALHYSWQDADPFPGGADFWGIHTGLFDRAGRPKPAWHAFSREVGRVTR